MAPEPILTWRKFLTLPGLKLRPHGRPAHSQSLHRLRYPASLVNSTVDKMTSRDKRDVAQTHSRWHEVTPAYGMLYFMQKGKLKSLFIIKS
jgi:hypothetical protein